MAKGIMLVVLTLGLLACASSGMQRLSQADRQSIAKLLSDQEAAWNRGEIDTFMHGYLESEDLVFTSGAKVQRGWQGTLERYKARYGTDTSSMGQLAFEIFGMQPVGLGGAVVLGRWALSGASSAGGIFSLVLDKTSRGWKIIHDHTSALAPKRETTEAEAVQE